MKTKRAYFLLMVVIMMVMFLFPAGAWAEEFVSIETWGNLRDALANGGSFILGSDVTAGAGDSSLDVPENVEVTLDLNGKRIDGSALSSDVLKVNGDLILTDGSEEGKGEVYGGNNGRTVLVNESGSFTMNGGEVSSNAGETVFVRPDGSFTMNGGTVSVSGEGMAPAVVVNKDGSFTMNSGTVLSDIPTGYSVFLFSDGSFTMNGGTVSNDSGFAVRVDGSFTMNGGEVSSDGRGAVDVDGSFTMTGGTVSGGNGDAMLITGGLDLSGAPTINGNVDLLRSDAVITVTGDLTNDAPISVKMVEPGVFARAAAGYNEGALTQSDAEKFISHKDSVYGIALNDQNELQLEKRPIVSWGQLSDALGEKGAFALGADVTANDGDDPLKIAEDAKVTLDLNGHMIDATALQSDGIEVSGGSVLTLTDSGSGGELRGNENFCGVSVRGIFNLTGGTLSGGKGVRVLQDSKFRLSGAPVIGGGVHLNSGTVIAIIGDLTNTQPIPVKMQTPDKFTWQLKGHGGLENFTALDDAYGFGLNEDGEAQMFNFIQDGSWADLKAALENGGLTILGSDVTAGENDTGVQIGEGVTATLDLNGHNINATALKCDVIKVTGDLTLTDSSQAGGTLSGGDEYNTVFLSETGSFSLYGAPNIRGRVYLSSSKVINVTGKLANAEPIPVAMQTPGVFTSELYGNGGAENFTAFDDAHGIVLDEYGEAQMFNFIQDGSWASLKAALENGGLTILGSDVTAGEDDDGIQIGGATTLDLNGHTIDGTALESDVIKVNSYLELTDSSQAGGMVSGDDDNNTVFVGSSGEFDLSGAVNIGGKVYLSSGTYINVTGALTNARPIPVSMEDPYVFTWGLNGYGGAANFVSADSDYVVILYEYGEAMLTSLEVVGDMDSLCAALQNGSSVIKLTGDIGTYGRKLVIAAGKTVTLDLNGHTIDRGGDFAQDGCAIHVLGDLTVQDSSEDHTGSITGGNSNWYGGGVFVDGGSFTLEGGSICNNTAAGAGSGVFVGAGSSFTLSGGSIINNPGSDNADDLALEYDAFNGVNVSVTAAPAAPVSVRFVTTGDDVTLPNPVAITTHALPGGVEPEDCFASNMSGYQVFADVDGRAVLATPVTVTWKNYDGTVLETQTVACESVPAYDGDWPTREATAQQTFTFSAWDDGSTTYILFVDDLPPAINDVTYTAVYTATTNQYTVTWKNEGSEDETETLEYGAVPTHDAPTRAATAQYTYTFAGWNDGTTTHDPAEALPAVTGNVTYTSTFTSAVNQYNITWNDGNGNVLKTERLAYGAAITAPDDPTRKGYDFDGWSDHPETMPGSDVTVSARWNIITYSITCEPADGTNPNTYTVESDNITLTNPVKDGAVFLGWTGSNGTTPQKTVTIPKGTTGNLKYVANWAPVYAINIDGGIELGDVKADMKTAAQGETVTLTVTPDADCLLANVSVTYTDEADQQQTVALTQDASAKKWSFNMPAHDVTVSAVFAESFGTPNFVLPASVWFIKERAFEGIPNMTVVEIPDGCQAIDELAFKDCKNLTKIRIPASVNIINDTAFDGCTKVFVYGTPSSAAETFCATHANCIFVAESAGA